MKRKILSLVLTALMVTGLIPGSMMEVYASKVENIYLITKGSTGTESYHVYRKEDGSTDYIPITSHADADTNTGYSTIENAMAEIKDTVGSGSATLEFAASGTNHGNAAGTLDTGADSVELDGSGTYIINGSLTSISGRGTFKCHEASLIVSGSTTSVVNTGTDGAAIESNGSVSVSGGTIQAEGIDCEAIRCEGAGTVSISGGKIFSKNDSAIAVASMGNVTISGSEWNDAAHTGTLVRTDASNRLAIRFDANAAVGGTLTVNGGTVSSGGKAIGAMLSTITINGGKITGETGGAAVIVAGTLTVNGGELSSGNTGINAADYPGVIWISDVDLGDSNLYLKGGSVENTAPGCPAVFCYRKSSTFNTKVYLSGTPSVSGTADIWTNTPIYADDGAASPVNYTGSQLTLEHSGTTVAGVTVAVAHVSAGVNDTLFTISNPGYTLHRSGTDLVIGEPGGGGGGGDGGGGGNGGGSHKASGKTETPNGASIVVDGKTQTAGTTQTTEKDGKKTITVTIGSNDVDTVMKDAGNNATLKIPVTGGCDKAVGRLDGLAVKNMEKKEAVIDIDTGSVSYTLPAAEIDIDAVSAQFGNSVALKDITVDVSISGVSDKTADIVKNAAANGGYSIMVPAVEFTVNCTYGGKTVEAKSFRSYVERMIAIPDGIDPNKITTGIVVEPDGSIHHVPTEITVIGGKYYAKINSLTNSVYSIIYHPVEFADVTKHWAKDAINDMGSRLVVSGKGNNCFDPGSNITRAEFAAIIVRALGLEPGKGDNNFGDVSSEKWYSDYIKTASSYGIITGYDAATFGPNNTITREQAMTMIARAMKITGLAVDPADGEISSLLAAYKDSPSASGYAKESIAKCLKAGVVSGTGNSTISPKANITRAEVATIVQRLLNKSELI